MTRSATGLRAKALHVVSKQDRYEAAVPGDPCFSLGTAGAGGHRQAWPGVSRPPDRKGYENTRAACRELITSGRLKAGKLR